MITSRPSAAHAALVVAALAACGEDVASISLECRVASDCPAPGATCDVGRCVAPPLRGPARVHVELVPPDGSPYVKTQRLDLSLEDATLPLDVRLEEPAEYQFLVLDADGTPLDARVVITGQGRIPERTVDAVMDLRKNNRRTQTIRLAPGTYGVRIERLDGRPSLDTTFTVRAPSGAPLVKEFRFAAPRRIFGEVTSSLSTDTKLSGVRVLAFSMRTGLASTATTSGAAGRYAIELPDTDDTAFRILATPGADVMPAWGYEEIVLVERGADREKRIPIEPTSPAIRGFGRLRFGGPEDGFEPAKNANVTLTATTAEGLKTRVYALTGTTNAEGWLDVGLADRPGDVPLLKGRYVVDVDPASDGPFGRVKALVDLTRTGPGVTPEVQVLLPLEVPVRGAVRSELGRPVVAATIELRLLGSDREPAQLETDDEGNFAVELEPGRYLLVARPSGASDVGEPLPVAAELVEISAPAEGARAFDVFVTLPRGVWVSGSVVGAIDERPLEGASVELFSQLEQSVVGLGSVRTDGAGRFSILVPAPAEP
ncbi:carboxypeptidase-like regulatory domain-containing protein [Myxococcota bacterium]|nr:carboxypeptidase-like regulatory domain-containing protein [Myxococcota bacterium]